LLATLGQFNLGPPPYYYYPYLAYDGSNFLLNYSNLLRSILVTDLLADKIASEKCFLVISGTGSYYTGGKLGFIY
jgi:hypothetical protein